MGPGRPTLRTADPARPSSCAICARSAMRCQPNCNGWNHLLNRLPSCGATSPNRRKSKGARPQYYEQRLHRSCKSVLASLQLGRSVCEQPKRYLRDQHRHYSPEFTPTKDDEAENNWQLSIHEDDCYVISSLLIVAWSVKAISQELIRDHRQDHQ